MSTYHYIALGMFIILALLDYIGRGSRLDDVPGWRLRGTVSTISYFAILTYAPLLWDSALGQYRLIPADTYPLWMQVVGGLFVYELGVDWWHRTMHRFDWLWRHTHQMHHSAERVDIWGAFWFHPLDSRAGRCSVPCRWSGSSACRQKPLSSSARSGPSPRCSST